MSEHLSEDDLVLHYYGELSSNEESHTTSHLTSCARCQESLRTLQRVLAVIDENAVAGPELPAHFERTVWARLEPGLQRSRGGWWSWLVLSPGRMAAAAIVVLLVGAAFMAGRLLPRPQDTTVTTA